MLIVFRDATVWRERVAGFAAAPVDPAYANGSYTVVRVGPTTAPISPASALSVARGLTARGPAAAPPR